MTRLGAILFMFSQLFGFISSQNFCPMGCRCMWKSGKKSVDCIDSNLVGIPQGIGPGIQILDLTGNVIRILPNRIFFQLGLVHLQKIYLPRCTIAEIGDDAFYQVSNLIEMDLSSNFLTWVPTAIFKDTPLLRRLLLSHNPIQRLENGSFEGLSHLTTLELSNCQIQSVDVDAFRGLGKLEYLKLDGNRLEIITKDVIRDLPPLYALDLHRNSWTCDCRVGEVRLWMVEHNVPFSDPPRCERPLRLRGLFWDVLDVNDLACPPEAESVQSEMVVTEGEDAELKCKIRASPEGTVRWIWRGRSIANLSLISFGKQMYLIREIGKTDKLTLLTIFNVMLKDSGRYTCWASNPAGNVSAEIVLTVLPKVLQPEGLTGGEISAIVIGSIVVVVLTVALFLVLFHHRLKLPTREEKLLILPKPIADLFSFRHNGLLGRNSAAQKRSNRVQNPIKKIAVVLEDSIDEHNDPLSPVTSVNEITDEFDTVKEENEEEESSESPDVDEDQERTEDNTENHLADQRGKRPGFNVVENPTQKHEVVVAVDQVHQALSPAARDSPDEGLGDEREYDTEVID